MNTRLQSLLDDACKRALEEAGVGKVADYIPALARIDPRKLGASVVTIEGQSATFGDSEEPFTIQSVSKVFSLALALEDVGQDLWQRVGREPSGNAFNSTS